MNTSSAASLLEGLDLDDVTNLIESLNYKVVSLQARLAEAERNAAALAPTSPKTTLDRCPVCGTSAADQLDIRFGRSS